MSESRIGAGQRTHSWYRPAACRTGTGGLIRRRTRGSMGQNGRVESTGRHAGKRRAEPAPEPERASSGGARGPLLGLALGVTLSVVAWGYLVYAAIDFGSSARGGQTRAWVFLGL